MATAPTKKKQGTLVQVATYPIDWLEERSGLVGGIKYFLFRKVPSDIGWYHTLGSATLTAFIVQAVTGVILAMYYKPDPNSAYESIQAITNDLTLGWLVRGMHRWGASVFIILMFFHMGRVFLFGAYKYPRELNWIIGVLILATGMFEGFTGYLLPWDQTAYWASVVGININGTGPFVGPFLASFLRGGAEIAPDTLPRFYSLCAGTYPGGNAAGRYHRQAKAKRQIEYAALEDFLVGKRQDIRRVDVQLYLVVRLGLTPNPCSKYAGGD